MVLATLPHASYLALFPILCVVWALVPWVQKAWRYRNVPGPFALPFIGNIPGIVKLGLHEYMLQCRFKYGKVFKVWMGNSMLLVCADPEICRRVNYKMINRQIGGQLKLDDQDDVINNQGLVVAKGERWRTLRLAWQPAFQSGSLEGYSDLMDSCAKELAEYVAELGKGGQEVEIWRELGKMTLAVVGSTAFGVDFHTLHAPTNEAAKEGTALIKACQTVFAASSLAKGSIYMLVNAVLPFPKFVGWMAMHFPDHRLTQLRQSRRTIRAVSSQLIADWRSAHRVNITASATATAPAAPPATKETPLIENISATVDVNDTRKSNWPAGADSTMGSVNPSNDGMQAIADSAGFNTHSRVANDSANGLVDGVTNGALKSVDVPVKRAGVGVAPGSFMGLMLSAREKSSGEALADNVIVGQANTFTLAGYETTANTLSYCVYNIASHPEVQGRLLAEIDAYGRHRKVACQDMNQFPYTEAIVRESLRLYPPATFLNREIKEGGFDLTDKVHVDAGQSVLSFLYGYQRDPDYWPAALEFRPERWLPEGADLAPTTPDAWTPFGTGPRMCIGWKFALQEAKIALVRLYQNQTYKLLPGQVPLALQQNITLSPRNGVRVRVVPRA